MSDELFLGRWDPTDDPDGGVVYPLALNNPPCRWNPKERTWVPVEAYPSDGRVRS